MPEEKRQQEDLQPFIELQEKLAMNISFQQAVSGFAYATPGTAASCSRGKMCFYMLRPLRCCVLQSLCTNQPSTYPARTSLLATNNMFSGS
jgi:hypothetical protein